jgi:hypothetical protein
VRKKNTEERPVSRQGTKEAAIAVFRLGKVKRDE